MRTQIGIKFLPIRKVLPKTTSIPSDIVDIVRLPDGTETLTVDEGATTRLSEYWVEFALTHQQVEHETGNISELGHSTAVTLATRAANFLSQAVDLIIFQGANAFQVPFFKSNIRFRGQPADTGLLDLPPGAPALPAAQVINVPAKEGQPGVYAEGTFKAVAQGYATLEGIGQYGPFALVLQTTPYADTYAPIRDTLILTADRLKPLMTAGFFGSGTLVSNSPPTEPAYTGVLVSLGGNSMDLVVGLDATTAFMQTDTDGNYRFRVLERFALRLKDITAVVRFEFQ
jgi:uncharacterized linocin/CFP29 family protein